MEDFLNSQVVLQRDLLVGVPPFKAISLVLISVSVTASVSRFQGEISLDSSQGRIFTVRVELFQQL